MEIKLVVRAVSVHPWQDFLRYFSITPICVCSIAVSLWSLIEWDYLALNILRSHNLWMLRLEVLLELSTALDKCTSFQWELAQLSILSSRVQVFAIWLVWRGPTEDFNCFRPSLLAQNGELFSILFPSLCLVGIQLWLFKVGGECSGFWLLYYGKNCRPKLSHLCSLESILGIAFLSIVVKANRYFLFLKLEPSKRMSEYLKVVLEFVVQGFNYLHRYIQGKWVVSF